MSKFSEFLRKPYSVTVDAIASGIIGAAVFLVFQALPNILPFQGALEVGLSGVIAAMVYMRARDNLTKTDAKL